MTATLTRSEWTATYRAIRTSPGLRRARAVEMLSCFLGGGRGGYWFTRKHANGHLAANASHANVLGHAAAARRGDRADHPHFMAKARLLRKNGTWFA